jgi:hypothetical protein
MLKLGNISNVISFHRRRGGHACVEPLLVGMHASGDGDTADVEK